MLPRSLRQVEGSPPAPISEVPSLGTLLGGPPRSKNSQEKRRGSLCAARPLSSCRNGPRPLPVLGENARNWQRSDHIPHAEAQVPPLRRHALTGHSGARGAARLSAGQSNSHRCSARLCATPGRSPRPCLSKGGRLHVVMRALEADSLKVRKTDGRGGEVWFLRNFR